MAADYSVGNEERRVADPEEYNQTQRLRAINQARQRVEDTIEQSMVRLRTDTEFEEPDRQQVVRASLYSYLTNIEWLMVAGGETKLLKEKELGTVTINPPQAFVEWGNNKQRDGPTVIGPQSLGSYEHPIYGIQGYLTAPEVFEASWSLDVQKRHSSPQTVSRAKQTFMPVHISLNAFRLANRFLNESGIDIELKEDEGDAGFDYEDILVNGPPGQREPPQIQTDGGDSAEGGESE